MSDAEMIQKLLAACKAYHDALDLSFALLIGATALGAEPFMPSQSPMWPTMVAGHSVVVEIEAELSRRGEQ